MVPQGKPEAVFDVVGKEGMRVSPRVALPAIAHSRTSHRAG